MGFPRQEYWSGLPFSSPRDLSDLEMEPASPLWQAGSLPLSHLGTPVPYSRTLQFSKFCYFFSYLSVPLPSSSVLDSLSVLPQVIPPIPVASVTSNMPVISKSPVHTSMNSKLVCIIVVLSTHPCHVWRSICPQTSPRLSFTPAISFPPPHPTALTCCSGRNNLRVMTGVFLSFTPDILPSSSLNEALLELFTSTYLHWSK